MNKPFQNVEQLRITLLFFIFMLSFPAFASTNSPYEDGLADYQAKRYHAAEQEFERAQALAPTNARILIALGRTREMLRDTEGAKAAYQAAFNLNPFGPEGQLARSQLMGLAQRIASQAAQPLDNANALNRIAQTIHRQSSELAWRYYEQGETNARWSLNLGNIEARRAGYRGRLTYADLLNGQYWRNDFGDVSDPSQIRSSYLRMDAAAQANLYRARATQSANAAIESGNNLVYLLAEPHRANEAHLRALGTSLYVRYYGEPEQDDLPPVDPIIELHAVAQRLSQLPTGMHAHTQKL